MYSEEIKHITKLRISVWNAVVPLGIHEVLLAVQVALNKLSCYR